MNLKRVELAWRALWIRILIRLMRRARRDAPDWGSRPHRVLFLRHDRAGDMILSTGVMRAIARSHPTISLDVLASPANASILDASDYVREVIVFDKRKPASYLATARHLRRQRYDAVIDCMVTAPSVTTLLLIFASNARHRVGIAGRGNESAFNVNVPPPADSGAHMVDHLGALAAAFGVTAEDDAWQPTLDLTDEECAHAVSRWKTSGEPGPRVLVNVSAGTPARLWSDDHYVAVMRHIRARVAGATLRVVGAPAEMGRAEYIAREGAGELVRTPGLREAIAMVATADVVFTPDTSIAHAASAFRRPCVAMYVRGSALRWGLRGTIGESVEHSEPTLTTLSLARMLTAVDAVLETAAVSRRG
jgi:heptosyltransferase IV